MAHIGQSRVSSGLHPSNRLSCSVLLDSGLDYGEVALRGGQHRLVQGVGFQVLGFRFQLARFWILGFGYWGWGLRFGVLGSGFEV